MRKIIFVALGLIIVGCLSQGNAEPGAKELSNALKSNKPVLLFFHADWCAICKDQAPIINELEKTYGSEVIFIEADADENPELLARYNLLKTLPTIVLFDREGRVKAVFPGFVRKEVLEEKLQDVSAF
jgi:thioredoxin 1